MTALVHALATVLATDDIRDIRGPLAIPEEASALPLVALGILALAAIGLGIWWRRRKPPAPTPAERALGQIEAARRFMQPERSRLFCGVVSAVMRHYVEDGFAFHATQRTTEEFLASLRDEAPLALQENRGVLERFLACCDYAKYAGYRLQPKELEGTYAAAVAFVEATRDAPSDPPAPIDYSNPPSAHVAVNLSGGQR